MKKLMFLIFLLFSLSTYAQKDETIIYGSFAPQDLGIGFRCDIQGGYLSYSYGNYMLPYGGYIKDHTKLAMGFLYKQFSAGITWHEYGEIYETVPLKKNNLRHLSFELGGKVYLERIVVGFRTDILRYETTFDIGYLF